MTSHLTVEWWAWVAVIAFILAMLAVDLLFFHREAHEVSIKEAATWSGIWINRAIHERVLNRAGGRARAEVAQAFGETHVAAGGA